MDAAIIIALLAAAAVLALSLRRAKAELQTIASHAPSAMAHVVGRGGKLKYRFVNQKYAALYGRQPADVIGKHPKDVLGAAIYARSHTNMCRAIAGETITFDLELGDKSVEVVYYPDTPPPGKAHGFIGVITDVSELRSLQRSWKLIRGLHALPPQGGRVSRPLHTRIFKHCLARNDGAQDAALHLGFIKG